MMQKIMSYRNKTYVIFNGDDIHYYRLMQAWKGNDNMEFDFNDAHDIGGIREDSEEVSVKNILEKGLLIQSRLLYWWGKIQNTNINMFVGKLRLLKI